MVFLLKRDCLSCGGSEVTEKICNKDPKKRPIKIDRGYRPDWCPIDDSKFTKEYWEAKKHATTKN